MYATPHAILTAKKFFQINPDGLINTGDWKEPTYTKEAFYKWFNHCLNMKTGGEELTEKDYILMRDARRIKDYYQNRVHCQGRNLLNTPKLKVKYPHIDNYTAEPDWE